MSETTSEVRGDDDAQREIRALRERLAALEDEHAEEIARLQAALARAQERAYWLDRWHVDLNRTMTTRPGRAARAVVRAVRTPVRLAILLRRQLNSK